jgi:hypothetical protein
MHVFRLCTTLGAVALAALSAGCSRRPPAQPNAHPGWTQPPAGQAAAASDLISGKLIFDDEFDTLDVGCFSFTGSAGDHRWYIQKNAGSGIEQHPCSGQITVDQGVLSMRMSKAGDVWRSGEVAGMDAGRDGKSFAPPFYAEARIKLPAQIPPGLDVWPTFWMNAAWSSPGTERPFSEFDILEAWGQSGAQAPITLHVWPARPPEATVPVHAHWSIFTKFSPFDGQWHAYGLKIDATQACAYRDRVLQGCIARTGLPMDGPFYPVVSLNLKGPATADPSATYTMQVDYVRIYAPPGS